MAKINVRTHENTHCFLCHSEGTIAHADLADSQGLIDGLWNLYKCQKCSLVWLHPQPAADDIPKLYPPAYYTHRAEGGRLIRRVYDSLLSAVAKARGGYGRTTIQSWIGWCFGLIPLIRIAALRGILFVQGPPHGIHLDVGCGSGLWLKKTKKLGWAALGIDHDKEAVELARASGLNVLYGNMEDSHIASASIEVVTARHVIEHVPEPITFLKECFRVLKPGGRIIIITPNIEGFGARTFLKHWRGLEPPRHLYLFSARSLAACARAAGFDISTCATLTISAFRMAMRSYQIKNQKTHPSLGIRIQSFIFMIKETMLNALNQRSGEEVLLIATKQDV